MKDNSSMKRRRLGTLAAILIASLLFVIPSVGSQVRAPAPELVPWSWLAFQSYRANNWDIYVEDSDGSEVTQVTTNTAADVQPRLNYDCTRITFASNRTGNYEIYVMNLDGSGLIQLTNNGASDMEPFWSPDGTQIVWESSRTGQGDLYVMNADGSGQTRLTSHASYDGQPAWSPDGGRIAFVSKRTGPAHIWVMNADGSDLVELSTQAKSENPAWSPDAGQIAYNADGNGDTWQELWLMNADGTAQQQIYGGAVQTNTWAGNWSPDGRYVGLVEVDYQWQGGQWQWHTAFLMAWDSTTGTVADLPSSGQDWQPDWRSADPWPPSSNIQTLPAESPAVFTVAWSGWDEGPSGVESYDVQVRDGEAGVWTEWQSATAATNADYTGLGGHTYYFRCRARDHARNVESWPAAADAHTQVESAPPRTSVQPLPAYAHSGVEVQWSGYDPGNSGIEGYDVQYRPEDGDWIDWQVDTMATSAVFSEASGLTYYFRSRATDRAMNVERWPAGSGDASVTLYTWSISGAVYDNAHTPVEGAAAGTIPAAFRPIPSDGEGRYASYVATESATHTVTWEGDGFGLLPATEFTGGDAQLDVILPPAGDVVSNGGFEDGTAGWQVSGQYPPMIVDRPRHTGRQAAGLGQEFEFGPASNVSNNTGTTPWGPAIAVDGDYTAHVLWSDDNTHYDRIYYAAQPEGGVWSAPVAVSGEQSDGPALAVDGSDTVHAVWREFSRIVYAFKPKGGSWSSQIPISNDYSYWPDIAVDGDGTLHVVWDSLDIIYMEKPVGGDWSEPIGISRYTDSPGAHNAKLAVDREGGLHAVWFQYIKSQWQIFYAHKPHDGDWSAPVQLTSDGGWMPNIAVDDSGMVHVVWDSLAIGDTGVKYATQQGDEPWSAPVPIIGAGTTSPAVAAFANGTVHVVCRRDDGVQYAWRSPDGEWQPAVTLFSGESTYPRIALDATGLPSVAWTGYIGGNGETLCRTPRLAEQSGDALLSQSVVVPGDGPAPVLSFLYQSAGLSESRGTQLSVRLNDGLAVTEIFSTTVVSDTWTHRWFDLGPWAGRSVALTFEVHETANQALGWVGLDEVSLGPAYPDVWARQETPTPIARRGDHVSWILTAGNRGGAVAAGVRLTDTLPLGLSFVEANPPPQFVTPDLIWEIGDLSARNEPWTIVVTTEVAPTATLYGALTNTVSIETASVELQPANNRSQGIILVAGRLYLPLAIKGQ
jgi:uncharacterized repeat protein (TIGR01451 family)